MRRESSGRSGSLAPDPASSGSEKVALFSLIIYKWNADHPLQLAVALDLSLLPYFRRGTIKEHIIFHSRLIAARTMIGNKQVVEFEQNLGHCHVFVHPDGLAASALTTTTYPMRVAFGLISNAVAQFQKKYRGEWEHITEDVKEGVMFGPEGAELLKAYQNPLEADKLLRVQKNLDEVKDVMLKNIDDLLRRGEKLDDLMQKSEDLSNTSYQFYRQAKKNNQCCQWY